MQTDGFASSDPPGAAAEQYFGSTQAPAMTYEAHAAAIGFVFYTGNAFPANYQGDGFVAMHGSWNRNPAAGFEVVHVQFENGQPVSTDPFVTGCLMPLGATQFGRVAGLAVSPDGSLLISDDANGVIYRVTYAG